MERKGLRDLSRDSDEVARYYDDWADDYDATLDEWRYEAPRQVASRLRAALSPDAVMLDAGCGTGLSGRALSTAGFRTIDGMDVSQRSLEIAARLGVYRSLVRVDMQKLPLPYEDNAFDGLACVGVLTYVPDSAGILREFCRIVRAGGVMIFTQRSDLLVERDFRSTLTELEADGLLAEVDVSGEMPYLPENPEFGDDVKVHYIRCSVQ
ncbi:MAG: class I SAM-dependent methyltransferase [Woeseiaceae bacterium]|nr:class I SAM-dependent methyltransferase [Woeseiaceae bacterium]